MVNSLNRGDIVFAQLDSTGDFLMNLVVGLHIKCVIDVLQKLKGGKQFDLRPEIRKLQMS